MRDKLSCIIIDDAKKDRENISLLLENYCPQIEIIGEANDKKSIIEILSKLSPDLVFMDIKIGEFTAFEILNELNSIPFEIVFVSAYDKYAIKGYEYEAFDYILKPIETQKLIKTVIRVSNKIQFKNVNINNIDNNGFQKKPALTKTKISVTDSKGIYVIDIDSIIYCLSNGNYTTFILKDKKEIVISKNLKHFEKKLSSYGFFIRIHKSYLVNINHVSYLCKEQGGSVVMINNDSLPISKNLKKDLYHKINII